MAADSSNSLSSVRLLDFPVPTAPPPSSTFPNPGPHSSSSFTSFPSPSIPPSLNCNQRLLQDSSAAVYQTLLVCCEFVFQTPRKRLAVYFAYLSEVNTRRVQVAMSTGSTFPDYERIDDEDALESLINQTEDLEERRKIRRRQRNIREKRQAEYEANRVVRVQQQSDEDATQARLRRAQEEKERKLRELEEKGKLQRQLGSATEDAVRQRQANAEEVKQQKLQHLRDMGKILSTVYNTGVNDILQEKHPLAKDDVNSANFMRNDVRGIRDNRSVQGFGGTSYGTKGAPPSPATQARGGVNHNPTAIKQILLDWAKAQVAGYDNVNVTNFSSSWSDGLAFCALIHHFHPEAFDFKKLNPQNRRGNFTLAFTTAEKLADIYPVLDVEDMVHMKNPDWKCVFTYVQGFYRQFAQKK